MVSFLKSLVKLPVAVAGLIGLVLATWLAPTRLRVPLALLLIGLGTFVLVGAAGLSVINRYLLVPSLMVMLFAAVAVGGFTMLEHGRARTAWTVLAAAAIAFALVWTLLRVDLTSLTNELRSAATRAPGCAHLLDDPEVRAAEHCGPVLTPNHRLIPDVRWIMNLPEDRVVARSDLASARRACTAGSRSCRPGARSCCARASTRTTTARRTRRTCCRRPATCGSRRRRTTRRTRAALSRARRLAAPYPGVR